MSFFNFFSIHNTLVHIPLGNMPYAMSYIEAIAAIFGLFCIWFASKGKIINYFFGLVNVVLFGNNFLSNPTLRPVITASFLFL